MADFNIPDWIRDNLSRDDGQVSHGLNLALPLEDSTQLPCLLLDIRAAQPKIRRALEELGFLHFARFVPSWDGSALMVTTEYDGPLEPYVMDFAITIGDVFDTLLGYVDKRVRPPLPIRDHPDEFWEFVRKWNRVPIGPRSVTNDALLLPESLDYPVFCAYPDKTALDIMGPRLKLPAPVTDRPAAAIDMKDVQGNILRGYGTSAARHFLLKVVDADQARTWFAGLADSPSGDIPKVTTAEPWPKRADETIDKPSVLLNLGFTHAGLRQLLPQRHVDLASFPLAFREGPAHRAEANGDRGDSAPAHWVFGQQGQDEHVMLSLYAFDRNAVEFRAACQAVEAGAGQHGLQLLGHHDAQALDNDGTIHFGYRDGIAQPRIAGQCNAGDDMQPACSPGEFLLGKDYVDIYGGRSLGKMPGDLATNGTFCAVRLLQQDVDSFDSVVADAAIRAAQAAGQPPTADHHELIAAKLLGRWRDGTPVTVAPTIPEWKALGGAATARNDFDYAPSYEYQNEDNDHQGLRCPVGAHIRRSNPRTARVAGARHTRRLLRRGMPYTWRRADGTDEKGLFGFFLCGSLERQFEFIQQQWIDGDLAASGIRGTQDPIAGAASLSGKVSIPGLGQGGEPLEVAVPRLTTTRGSLYLFLPGLNMLRSLAPQRLLRAAEFSSIVLDGLFEQVRKAVVRELGASFTDQLRRFLYPQRTEGPEPAAVVRFASGFDPSTFDPTDPRFIANPYPVFEEFRVYRPVHWVPQHKAYWVFSRTLVTRLCREPLLFRQKPRETKLIGLLTMDPPKHTQVRKDLELALRNAMARAADAPDKAITQALQELQGERSFDLVPRFAARIPQQVFFDMLGLHGDDRDKADRLARTVMAHADTTLDIVQQAAGWKAAAELALLLGLQLSAAWATAYPKKLLNPNFKGTLLQEIALLTGFLPIPPFPQDKLSISEAVMTTLQFVLAGYLSSEFLLATATRNLLLPDDMVRGGRPWDQLVKKASKLEDALAEARRYDSPLGVIERYAAEDMDFGGLQIKKDSLMLGLLGSANRDADGWGAGTDLGQFDIRRAQTLPHVALGEHIHRCIGAPLQQLVVPMAMQKLIDAMPKLRLQTPKAVPPWLPNIYFRSFAALPVTTCGQVAP